VIGYQPGKTKKVAEAAAQRSVHPRLPALEGVLKQDQAGVQNLEPVAALGESAHGA